MKNGKPKKSVQSVRLSNPTHKTFFHTGGCV